MGRGKSKRGVLVRVIRKDGALAIRLDDAVQVEVGSDLWKRDVFVTEGALDEERFEDMKFDDKELADFGYYVLARLYAYKQVGEGP